MADPTVFVSSPERKERKGGIKSVIGDFVAAPRLGAAHSIEWVADNCEFPKATPQLCFVPNPLAGNKTFTGVVHGTGPIWSLYSGVKCYLGENSDYESRARAVLAQGEDRGAEEALWTWGQLATPGPAQTSWIGAIGEADEAADTLYLGLPVIMMSRYNAVRARAAGVLFGGDAWDGALWTANGTPVINSAAASNSDIIVMGWPTVYASEVTATRAMDHTRNQEFAMAERMYGLAVDCGFRLKYSVTIAGQFSAEPEEAPPATQQQQQEG